MVEKCYATYGVPVWQNHGNGSVLIGMTLQGLECDKHPYPNPVIRIKDFLPWIKDVIHLHETENFFEGIIV